MALKECKECKQNVSSKAKKCPHCGAPIKARTSPLAWFFLIVLLVMIFGYLLSDNDKPLKSSYYNTRHETNSHQDIPEPKDARYVHSTINIRSGPGMKHPVVGKLQRGEVVNVLSENDGWATILMQENAKGFIFAELLKPYPIPPVEVVDWNWYPDPDFGTDGTIVWNVKLRNNTSKYLEDVKVEFSTYDANGKLITSGFSYVHGLSPGGTATDKSYETFFGTEKTANIRVVPPR